MFLECSYEGKTLRADLNKPFPIGVSISRLGGLSSFNIQAAEYREYQSEGFVGNTLKGGSCNLETITFTPHGNGTHTECVGHISTDPLRVTDCISDKFYTASLITLDTTSVKGLRVLNFESLDWNKIKFKCLVIRSTPNDSKKTKTDYSGKNAPFILPKDMKSLVNIGIEHILIDLPSVDPEWDDGKLACHHIFWNYPEDPRSHCSITEFCYIPNELLDGEYILKLNIAPFESDASPSSPVLYPIV